MYASLELFAAVAALASSAMAAPPTTKALVRRAGPWPARENHSGRVTSYGGNLNGGTCSFASSVLPALPAGFAGVALTESLWNNGYNCGGCVELFGVDKKPFKAMIVDMCPSCGKDSLDLFESTFRQHYGTPSDLPVDWHFVPCDGVKGPLGIYTKEGTSPSWAELQVVNARRRTKKMEYRVPGQGGWKEIKVRQKYNFFHIEQVKVPRIDIRVTSHVDTQVVVPGVALEGSKTTKAKSNYK